jgi:uncharacterized phage infection (PIP) family protein YhgE
MSFSTPGMVHESKIHQYSTKNMPLATSNSMMFQMKTAPPAQRNFQASQMRNPWAQQQLNCAQPPAQELWGLQAPMLKQTSWATSAVSPEVEMHIVSQSAEAAENKTNNSTEGHNTWTSAEELANAIFPSNLQADAEHTSKVHLGLLNHKNEIESLKQSLAVLENNHFHDGLLNHRTEIQNLKKSLKDITAKTSAHSDHVHLDHVHNGLLDHKKEIERLQKSVEELTTKSILLSANGARTNVKENVPSQDFAHAHEALLEHKKAILEHENSLECHNEGLLLHRQEIKSMTAKIASLESKQKDLLHHENSVACEKQGLLLQNQEIKSLTSKIATLESKHSALSHKHDLQSFKKDDNLLGKLEALDQRTREQMSLLREGHNSLLDAHQTCQQQVTSLSQLCSRPQERHVEFGANSYLQPPRSKFGK